MGGHGQPRYNTLNSLEEEWVKNIIVRYKGSNYEKKVHLTKAKLCISSTWDIFFLSYLCSRVQNTVRVRDCPVSSNNTASISKVNRSLTKEIF